MPELTSWAAEDAAPAGDNLVVQTQADGTTAYSTWDQVAAARGYIQASTAFLSGRAGVANFDVTDAPDTVFMSAFDLALTPEGSLAAADGPLGVLDILSTQSLYEVGINFHAQLIPDSAAVPRDLVAGIYDDNDDSLLYLLGRSSISANQTYASIAAVLPWASPATPISIKLGLTVVGADVTVDDIISIGFWARHIGQVSAQYSMV